VIRQLPLTVTLQVSARSPFRRLIPIFPPTESEELEALSILEVDPANIQCEYCGDKSTEWDHLRPLITNQQPTGYVTEIANPVPIFKAVQKSGAEFADFAKLIVGVLVVGGP
jgi:hypothetical protein